MPSISSRAGFNLRTFIAEHGFKAECGGGHFWRELWSPAVSQVYQEHLGELHSVQKSGIGC